MNTIRWIDENHIQNKRVLLRADYNVTLLPDLTVSDNERIKRSLPSIENLLKGNNKIIIISHLGRPEGKDPKFSLRPIAAELQKLLPSQKVIFIPNFENEEGKQLITNQKENEIILLENLRFYDEEKNNDEELAQKLAQLADIYVNEAFSISHRKHSSVVGVPKLLPSYGGLLLKKETGMISQVIHNPKRPYIVVMGGAKISTKIHLLDVLMGKADTILTGGGIANTILRQQGYEIGKSIFEERENKDAEELLELAKKKNTEILLPLDVITAEDRNSQEGVVKNIENVTSEDVILDIGPETCKLYCEKILQANTIVWNGPMGFFENPQFAKGTDCIYDAIISNTHAKSVVGGGQTIGAISQKPLKDKISHISTGGGALLEFIEKETLPGLEALSSN